MGFSIQIRGSDPLVIPSEAGYEPPLPTMPGSISFSPQQMSLLCSFMVAAGAVDKSIVSGKQRGECAKGQVPIYKFSTNDGYVVTAREAGVIADVMSRPDLFEPAFLTQHFPRFDPKRSDLLEIPRAMVTLWAAYNRVAAANNGYTIK